MPVRPKVMPVALVAPKFRAAAESMLRAPEVVVKLEAPLPVKEIAPPLMLVAPPVIVKPAEPVSRFVKVFAPLKV